MIAAPHMFALGALYSKVDIGGFLGGGNLQSGVLYGKSQPRLVAIFIGGTHSTMSGYPDEWTAEGVLKYCGQGSKGDQRLSGANAVIADPIRTILLFERVKGKDGKGTLNRFKGEFVVAGYDFRQGEGPRSGDKLIQFSLAPTAIGSNPEEESDTSAPATDVAALRLRAVQSGRDFQLKGSTKREYRLRSAEVHAYAMARSNGNCERCQRPAPFFRNNGKPFLEVHHTQRLADDGPDDILHVAAICPNCHREAHYGVAIDEFRSRLEEAISRKESGDTRLR